MSYREQSDKIYNNVNFSGQFLEPVKNSKLHLVPSSNEQEVVGTDNFQMMINCDNFDSKDF